MNKSTTVPRLSRREFLITSGGAAAALGLSNGTSDLLAVETSTEAVRPENTIELFNGKDFTGLYTWSAETKYENPHGLFSIENGQIRVLGRPSGYVATEKAYRDYHLIVEYKWGERTYGRKTVRNSGVLLHATGPDGGRRGTWMASIECQLAQGCVGDFIVIRGEDTAGTIPVNITCDTTMGSDGRTRWKKGGSPTPYSGKQFWWNQHDPEFEERIDTRGRWDPESPVGEWTRLECVCDGDRITVIVNGTPVNECYNVFPSAGKILLQSEGFEILFRKFELHPIKGRA